MASRRRTEIPLGRKPPTAGKLSVAEPTIPKNFFFILLMHICKKILLVDTGVKLGIYVCAVTVVSLVTDIFPFPQTFLSSKQNFLNQYFVKLGWGWTLLVLGSFVFITSYTYCCGNIKLVRRHMLRLAVGTFWWYTCTKAFNYIENETGVCQFGEELDYTSKGTCLKAGYVWSGFDISGHTFLMMHCLLMISEEVKVLATWEKVQEFIKKEEETPTERLTSEEFGTLKTASTEYKTYFRISVVLVTCLQLVWELMLFSTALYFHNMPSKLTAACFAIVPWFITYHMWYKIEDISPGLPGKGQVKIIK